MKEHEKKQQKNIMESIKKKKDYIKAEQKKKKFFFHKSARSRKCRNFKNRNQRKVGGKKRFGKATEKKRCE